MYINPVHQNTHNNNIRSLINLTENLKASWETFAKYGCPNQADEDEEGNRLSDTGSNIVSLISNIEASSLYEIYGMLKCLNIYNELEDATYEDRIKEANSQAEIVAWSLLRALDKARLSPV